MSKKIEKRLRKQLAEANHTILGLNRVIRKLLRNQRMKSYIKTPAPRQQIEIVTMYKTVKSCANCHHIIDVK